MSSLEGKVCIVTGAASGIGRAIARKFKAEGAILVLVDLDEKGLAKVAGKLEVEETHVLNVTDREGVEALFDRERVDVLCNNAGILDGLTPLHEVTDELWDKVQRVNVDAPFYASRAAVKKMVTHGGGTIVNTCSAASLSGGRAGFSYTASKHALLGMTRSIAWYYAEQGIRCNAVAPGAIQTKMHMRGVPNAAGLERYSKYFGTIPPHGKAGQVADAVAFLASDASSYINGECIAVDGGWRAF
jgi:NAD(P)-dependent dehydrogenase (short-subunit alcohol dehydrogenase family)